MLRLKNLGDGSGRPGAWSRWSATPSSTRATSFEALLEGWKHDVRNLWWVIDYNRQSLDGVVNDRLFGRIGEMFELVGLARRYIEVRQAAGDGLRPARRRTARGSGSTIAPTPLFRAGLQGWRAGRREALTRDLNQYPGVRRILEQHDDAALHRLMTNLAGNDMQAVLDAFEGVNDDTPTCFIAYTIKGQACRLPAIRTITRRLVTLDQMAGFKKGHGHCRRSGMEKSRRPRRQRPPNSSPSSMPRHSTLKRKRADQRTPQAGAISAALAASHRAKKSSTQGLGVHPDYSAEGSEPARRIATTSPAGRRRSRSISAPG